MCILLIMFQVLIFKEPTSTFTDSNLDFTSIDVIIQKDFVACQTKTASSDVGRLQVEGDQSSILTQWNEGLLLAIGGAPGEFWYWVNIKHSCFEQGNLYPRLSLHWKKTKHFFYHDGQDFNCGVHYHVEVNICISNSFFFFRKRCVSQWFWLHGGLSRHNFHTRTKNWLGPGLFQGHIRVFP